jgi:hypothetical protein
MGVRSSFQHGVSGLVVNQVHMISNLLFCISTVVMFAGGIVVIRSNTGEQDTLGGALVLVGFVLAALGALFLVAGM